MRLKAGSMIGGALLLALLCTALPAQADGIKDFTLIRAIPADAMIAVHARGHEGKQFVDEQFARVFEAVVKQDFGRDFKRLFKAMVEQQEEADPAAFDEQWQRITDLAAAVNWAAMCQRECAFAMKIGFPTGADLVVLMMPEKDAVEANFDGLTAMLKSMVELAPPDMLVLSSEGEGAAVVHRLAVANAMPPVGLTLARHKDVILVGLGSTLVEQSLALLRGESTADLATLSSTERFKQAFKRLAEPTDEFYFIDAARIIGQVKQFAAMAQSMSEVPATQPGDTPQNPMAFLIPLVDQFNLWDSVAGVATTNGMKTTAEDVTVLREEARDLPLYKAIYGNKPVRDPLKYVPKAATGVTINSGLDFKAFYEAALDFAGKNVPGGREGIALWQQKQVEAGFSIEDDLLSWLGGGFATFTAKRQSAYVTEWVWILEVRDEQKANAALTKLYEQLTAALAAQQGGVDDAKIEGAEGFKVILLPPLFSMMLGQPVVGVKDGHLFVGNSPKIVAYALKVGAGEEENFAKSESYIEDGLPLSGQVTAFSFNDLSKLGDELSQAFGMVGMAQMFMPPEVTRDPVVLTAMSIATKVGNVARTLDFYRSSCSVTTFDGRVSLAKSVTHYREPPRPKSETAPQPAGQEPEGEAEPAKAVTE